MNENQKPDELEQLRQQYADLQKQLEVTRAQRDEYKAAAYDFLEQLHPYVPPTEEELHDMLHGPRGQTILEIAKEFEEEMNRESK